MQTEKTTDNSKQLTLNITKFNDDYDGVCRVRDKTWHVKGALPGETVVAQEVESFTTATICKLNKILEPSKDRVAPTCRYYSLCGNCSLMHLSYTAQLAAKTATVKRKLLKLGAEVQPCVGDAGNMRNKVHLVFGLNKERITLGFFNEETHRAIDTPKCLRHGEWYEVLYKILVSWAAGSQNKVYDPRNGKGVLRFAVARCFGRGLSLTLVVTREEVSGLDRLYSDLCARFSAVALWLNVNAVKSNEVFAGRFVHVAGKTTVSGRICGISFELSPEAFFQTNTNMAERIYKNVAAHIADMGAETVVDAFSGIGITDVLFAKSAKQVISIELSSAAVKDAEKLAADNGITNIEFLNGDVNELLPKLTLPEKSVVFVDPPRRGLGETVCGAILRNSPAGIIYLSCNPNTLATDLTALTDGGYSITSVVPYDMFPFSKHVEVLVSLAKKA